MADSETIAQMVLALADNEQPGIISATETLSHAVATQRAATRGAWLLAIRQPGPFHVATLLPNSVEHLLWLEAAALVGATVVGGNSTHRGDELARDLAHTQCQLLITTAALLPLVEGHDLGPSLGVITADSDRVIITDGPRIDDQLAPFRGAHPADVVDATIDASTLGYLLFTSGTSGAPKAVRCSPGRLAMISGIVRQMFQLAPHDVCYAAMPLFHSNALMAGWGPSLAAEAAVAVPSAERFSASGFAPDVRRFGVTYFNYVGKPLSYILNTPADPGDAELPLRLCFGNEAAADDIDRFATRFGCVVNEAYGSSEGGASLARTPDTPKGALGIAGEGTMVVDQESGDELPRAVFDGQGRLLNAEECIGELVSKTGGQSFEGYWQNDAAMEARLRNGWYWTGDLAYRDEAGFFYFAGRDNDWVRVDGENFAAAPVERILTRHPAVIVAAVFAVPDEHVGDQVMAALELTPGAAFDPEAFGSFLDAQEDLGTKWAPKYVRISAELPKTATSKVVKKALRAERWQTIDPVWWRPSNELRYEVLDEVTAARLNEAVIDRVV